MSFSLKPGSFFCELRRSHSKLKYPSVIPHSLRFLQLLLPTRQVDITTQEGTESLATEANMRLQTFRREPALLTAAPRTLAPPLFGIQGVEWRDKDGSVQAQTMTSARQMQ